MDGSRSIDSSSASSSFTAALLGADLNSSIISNGSSSNGLQTTKVTVHSSHNGGVHCHSSRSSSTGSLASSGNSFAANQSFSAHDHGGFSCDSPEGGTIKKKPSKSMITFKETMLSSSPKVGKEVRFKDTFSTMEDSLQHHPVGIKSV